MALNPLGKTRPVKTPYLTVEKPGGWRYHVLKAYALDPDAPYARWYLGTESPNLRSGEVEYGDGYITGVTGRITYRDPVVPDSALPRHLR